jgi:hypothetical protein
MPPVKFPVPVTEMPVEVTANTKEPRIEMPNCPEPGRKIPVEGSDAKLIAGLAAVPFTICSAEAPACVVLAL